MALATALPPTVVPTREKAAPPRQRPRRAAQPRRVKLGPVGVGHHVPVEPAPARLTRRGVLACWLAGFVAVGVIAFGLTQAFQPVAPAVVGAQTVTVLPGQSLWSVATQVNPNVDPRVSIGAIRQANGLGSTSIIQPGSELSVPVYAGQR